MWCYTPDRDYFCILWNPQSTIWILMNGVISCFLNFCESDVNNCFYYLVLYMARFRMTISTLSQAVTKNLMGHRMHWGWSKIPQTYPWWQSFQEMKTCFRRKLTLWPGHLIVAETFGGWHPSAQREVKKLGSALARHTGQDEAEAVSHLWGRLGILLQRGNAAILRNGVPALPHPNIDGIM